MYYGKLIKITAFISTETLIEIRTWSEVFQTLKACNISSAVLYPAKLSCKIKKE
jgi:hypothetical protein